MTVERIDFPHMMLFATTGLRLDAIPPHSVVCVALYLHIMYVQPMEMSDERMAQERTIFIHENVRSLLRYLNSELGDSYLIVVFLLCYSSAASVYF